MATTDSRIGRARPLTAAERKRRQRERLQRAGLTAVEVWIPARHRTFLRRVEQLLRRDVVSLEEKMAAVLKFQGEVELKMKEYDNDHKEFWLKLKFQ